VNAGLWRSVRLELDRWTAEGLTAQFWIRDDDACAVTPQLERLAGLARRQRVRIGLAVIPAGLTAGLATYLKRGDAPFWPMCHGWSHTNHGRATRPAEFGPERPHAELTADLARARDAFARSLGPEPPVFVPPFGQITDEAARALQSLGFAFLSNGPTLFEARLARLHARTALLPALPWRPRPSRRLDVHIDPIDWRAKTAHSRDAIERKLVGELRIRRKRYMAPETPIGVLTHHLVHDGAIWDACEELLAMLRGSAAAAFPDPRQLSSTFAPGLAKARPGTPPMVDMERRTGAAT
jgi:peptidoglycan/xylan/chitin deacetylase (PgdA/CDA1 family)